MTTAPAPKSVFCHMVSFEHATRDGRCEWGAGEIQCCIYDSLNAAVADLKAYARYIKTTPCKDVCDFTDDGKDARLEFTDDLTGKRTKRWVTELPFLHG